MSTQDPAVVELLNLNRRLLTSIAEGDWETYAALCDPTLTAFEPESRGCLVEGLDFHRFYFERGGPAGPQNTTMVSAQVRLMGEAAVVSYVRLVQRLDDQGKPVSARSEETRVWQCREGTWRHVHFHRSPGD
jgi:calcium/calmodulin-dependent protein kinase (CaM kinase) II